MPKILIMVLSYNEGAFAQLMRTQQNSWDDIECPYTKTIYYHGGLYKQEVIKFSLRHGNSTKSWERLEFDITDEYYHMAGKFKMALQHIFDERFGNQDFDLIFRTNSSSYVNKKSLLEFAEKLPKEKLYAGWTFEDSNDDKGLCVSGAGIWLSRDTAEILMKQIDTEKEIEEDVEIGRILRRNGITAIDDKSRFDIPLHFGIVPFDRYHYRCKSGPANRIADIGNMKKLHHLLMSNYR